MYAGCVSGAIQKQVYKKHLCPNLTNIKQMRIALFSDIHANLPALESFFADVDSRKPNALYCLGHLVVYNMWPNEVRFNYDIEKAAKAVEDSRLPNAYAESLRKGI